MAVSLGVKTNPMDRRLDVTPRQETKRIAGVDGQASVEWLGPLPLARLMVLDLETCNRLSEEQRDRAKICVAVRPDAIFQSADLLSREGRVLHVPQVRFVVDVPPVNILEEVLGQL